MSNSEATSATGTPYSVTGTARVLLVLLAAEFLLGIGVSLIGLPSETSGASKAATSVMLTVHVVVALGLVVGAILTIQPAAAQAPRLRRQAVAGVALIALAMAAGGMVMILKSNWWSFLMAAGFIAAFVTYGSLYARSKDS